MELVTAKKIDIITAIAAQIVSQQTVDDLLALSVQASAMFASGKLAAEIAVKLILRLTGIEAETRSIGMIDDLVDQAETIYRENYAG